MKKLSLLFLVVLFLLSGCKKETVELIPSGEYKGSFARIKPGILPVAETVNLQIKGSSYSGSSNVKNYPAICSGTFSISGDKMIVNNNCVFTADFDWTLIFKGEYSYQLNGKQLLISREYPNGQIDSYTLEKVE